MKVGLLLCHLLLLTMIACSKSESIPGDHGAVSAQLNKTFFEQVGSVKPYNSNSPYLDKMQECIYADTVEKSCKINDLPLLGLSGEPITFQSILDRTLISHEFLGETFKQVLMKMNPDMLQLFGSVSAIVVSDKINPSFYYTNTGAIYLSGRYFWKNAEERKILTQVKDPRTGSALPLQFYFDWDYIKDGKSISSRANPNAQTYDEMVLNVAHLLFHELTHANDYFPKSLYSNPNLDQTKSYHEVSYERFSKLELVSDKQPIKTHSVKLKHIGQILYQGESANVADSALLAEEIVKEFKSDVASDSYAYSTRREDLAMQAEEALMLYYYQMPRYISVIKLPEANFVPPKNYLYQIAWGEKSRVLEEKILPRAIFAVTNDLGVEVGKKIEDKLKLLHSEEYGVNTSWDNIGK